MVASAATESESRQLQHGARAGADSIHGPQNPSVPPCGSLQTENQYPGNCNGVNHAFA